MADYNGWTNRETWLCNEWFPNFDEQAQAIFDDLDFEDGESEMKSQFIKQLGDCIGNNVDDEFCDFVEKNDTSLFIDILAHAFRRIDLNQIASHYWDSVDKKRYIKFKNDLLFEENGIE